MEKRCPRCSIIKPVDEFPRNRARRDGRGDYCSACMKQYRDTPERRAQRAVRLREWLAQHPDYYATHRRTHREKRVAASREFRSTERGKRLRADAQIRRANAKRSVSAVVEPYDRRQVFEDDGWTCWLCHEPVADISGLEAKGPTIDHVVPLSRGGHDTRSNVRLAHRSCNSSRFNRPPSNPGGPEQLAL